MAQEKVKSIISCQYLPWEDAQILNIALYINANNSKWQMWHTTEPFAWHNMTQRVKMTHNIKIIHQQQCVALMIWATLKRA